MLNIFICLSSLPHTDEVGTATRMKLINNMILGNVVASLAEGMALADKLGIDLEDFAEVLSLGSLSCRTVNHKAQGMLSLLLHAPFFSLSPLPFTFVKIDQ